MLTIDVPAYDYNLLTIEETRVAAGLSSSDSSQDALLNPLRAYISAAIAKACNVPAEQGVPPTLREEEVTETFRLKSRNTAIFLGRMPVIEITSVTEGTTVLSAADYEVEGQGLYRITGDTSTCWACGEISVSYVAGWFLVPEDLRYAAIKFVQAESAQGSRDPQLKRIRIEGVSEREYWVDNSKQTALVPPEVSDLLDIGGYIKKWDWMR
jgi:hypothetical protein